MEMTKRNINNDGSEVRPFDEEKDICKRSREGARGSGEGIQIEFWN